MLNCNNNVIFFEIFKEEKDAIIKFLPKDIKITIEKQTIIKINGHDKHQVGVVTAKIKSFRAPEPYKGKGIRIKGEYILRKEGKKK